jgi:hypothetical protein
VERVPQVVAGGWPVLELGVAAPGLGLGLRRGDPVGPFGVAGAGDYFDFPDRRSKLRASGLDVTDAPSQFGPILADGLRINTNLSRASGRATGVP